MNRNLPPRHARVVSAGAARYSTVQNCTRMTHPATRCQPCSPRDPPPRSRSDHPPAPVGRGVFASKTPQPPETAPLSAPAALPLARRRERHSPLSPEPCRQRAPAPPASAPYFFVIYPPRRLAPHIIAARSWHHSPTSLIPISNYL